MAQSQFKLRTIRSRDDYQSFQVILPKYNPERVKDIFLHTHPSQIITANQPFATLFIESIFDMHEGSEGSATHPLSIVLSGIVAAVGEHFEEIAWQGKKSWHLKGKAEKGNLQILRIRECDHQPQDEKMLGGDYLVQSTSPKHHRFSSSVSVCRTCKEPLWKYFEQKQIQITLGQLCSLNRLSTEDLEKDFSWSIIKNEQFTSTTEVARSDEVEVRVPHLAKATFLIEWEQHKRKANDTTVVMRLRRVICGHQKVVEGRCQFCMEQVAQEHINKMGSYLFHQQSTKSVLISGKLLRLQQEQYIQQLLSQEKAMIILDLDNTILHSHQISDLAAATVEQLSEYYIIPKIDGPFETLPNRKDLIVVKMRPYFRHFLYVITKYYEIYVYTKGTRIYAEEICKYIRAQYAGEEIAHPFRTWKPEPLLFLKDKKSFLMNIISRDEDENLQSKSFEKILPSKKEYHLILDDRRDVWKNSPSWFFTRQYYYFQKKMVEKGQKMEQSGSEATKLVPVINELKEECRKEATKEQTSNLADQNQPKEDRSVKDLILSEYKEIASHYPEKARTIEGVDRKDCFLLFAAHSLKKVHRRFFEALKSQQERPSQAGKQSKANLAYQYAKLKHEFFRNAKFHFFMEKGQDETNNSTISRAKKMGALLSHDSPKLAVRSRNLVKAIKKQGCLEHQMPTCDACIFYFEQNKKLNELFNSRVPVVSESWIHYCYEFNFPFSWEPFRLFDPFQEQLEHEHYYHVIQEQASAIVRKIEREMAQELAQ